MERHAAKQKMKTLTHDDRAVAQGRRDQLKELPMANAATIRATRLYWIITQSINIRYPRSDIKKWLNK